MTDKHDLQVRTVFSVSEPRQARSRKPARPTTSPATGGRSVAPVLGFLSLMIGAVWLYATWYPIDRYLGREMMLRGMAEMISFDFTAFMPQAPANLANPSSPDADDEEEPLDEKGTVPDDDAEPVPDDEADFLEDESALLGGQIIGRLTATMYVWLTVTTIVLAWLGLCGGASFGGLLSESGIRSFLRTLSVIVGLGVAGMAAWFWCYDWFTERYEWLAWGDSGKPPAEAEMILVAGAAFWSLLAGLIFSRGRSATAVIVLLVVLVGLAAYTWLKFGLSWPMVAVRTAILLLFGIAVLLGAAIRRRPFGLHKVAVVFIVLASLTTVGSIAYADRFDGFSDFPVTAASYAKAFGIQSAYAWLILLVLVVRARRVA